MKADLQGNCAHMRVEIKILKGYLTDRTCDFL